MSRNYAPDVWRVVEIHHPDGTKHQRVLAGWYGGYANGDSWKLSSGLEKSSITHYEDGTWGIDFLNTSGSIYSCNSNNWKFSGYTTSIYLDYKKRMEEAGGTFHDVEDHNLFDFLENQNKE